MAIYYVDIASGSDAAAGTAGAPLLTVNAAVAKASGPHDIRVAKTADYVSVSSTFTWTANSVTVNTSSDVSGSIAVGSYIGKPTAAGNGAEETFYRVNGVSPTAVTLELKYGGSTGSTSSCNKLVVVTTGAAGAHAMTLSNGTILSGGWNLTSQTQDGETWFKSNNARTVSFYGVNTTTNATISKINCVETNYGFGITLMTISNCTAHAYAIGIYTNTGGVIDACCASAVVSYSGVYGNNAVITCRNSFLLGIGGIGNFAASSTIVNNKIISGTSGLVAISGSGGGVTNCYFRNLTTGISSVTTNVVIDACTFENCGTGISTNTLQAGMVFKNCVFTNCTSYGIFIQQVHGVIIDSCSFSACGKGIYLDGYAGEVYLTNCTFNSPTTYGIDKTGTSGVVSCYGCTIDSGSIAKAYSRPVSGYALKMYTFQNSFGQTGTIWGAGSVTKDYNTFRTTAPSCGISWVSTTTANNLDVKIVSCFAKASTAKTFAMYLKASNASWAGTLTPKWKLDGVTIKTESNITALTTDWVLYTWTCAANLITADGELSMEFLPNMNNYAINVDDFTVS
ncbi:MAG: right-handed parallel beta-helix repeat-containing protein [archaeon]|jgi:hypothetical protein